LFCLIARPFCANNPRKTGRLGSVTDDRIRRPRKTKSVRHHEASDLFLDFVFLFHGAH
jgi:hypothetical protein